MTTAGVPPRQPLPASGARAGRVALGASAAALVAAVLTGVGGVLGLASGAMAVRALRTRRSAAAGVAAVLSLLALLPGLLLASGWALGALPAEQRYQACSEQPAPRTPCRDPLTSWLP